MATLSVYADKHEVPFEENAADIMANMNDNDKARFMRSQDKQYIRLKNRIKKADEHQQ